MASGDALAVPQRGLAFRLYFEWRKNDGSLLTGAAGVVSQISKDGAAFAATTNTVTEIGAGTGGVYFLDFTATEMGSVACIVLKVTSTSTNAIPVVESFYPTNDLGIPVNTSRIGGSVQATYAQQILYDNNIITGNVDVSAGGSTTDFYASLDNIGGSLGTDYFKGRTVCFTGPTVAQLAGVAARILAYNWAAPLHHFTITPVPFAATANSKFAII